MLNKSFRILILGSGGREHAFAWKLSQSRHVENITVIPGNGGTSLGLPKVSNFTLELSNFTEIVLFAKSKEVNLVVPSSEGPLVAGITDAFLKAGIACFGPTKAAAILEGSKVFSKSFMRRHNIPTAEFEVFDSFPQAKAYIEAIQYPIVIKASGLAAGKGVLMPNNKEDAISCLEDMMVKKVFGSAGDQVVIEERLEGDEISVAICSDGWDIKMFPAGQDHQRVFAGNVGPNTGGMGCYAPTPLCSDSQLHDIYSRILLPTIDGMREEGTPFVGMICIGVIMTSSGPKNLEYNVRFGDPEAQILFPLLTEDSDLALIISACTEKRLAEVTMNFKQKFAANVVLCSVAIRQCMIPVIPSVLTIPRKVAL
ncbi:hypothetical protein ONS95_004247 [Cadophora gregata]|uniref:uncharacterized protein n=1 Tax=Cadophora gregata TaxID=51156 RepID=UPI0026DB33E1|nr:uncharacterized protein ONS95_004247 [Cadophora gregata]KAK0105725.1 hypothetical protein ONS95_004247 [Cadophora gregata]